MLFIHIILHEFLQQCDPKYVYTKCDFSPIRSRKKFHKIFDVSS